METSQETRQAPDWQTVKECLDTNSNCVVNVRRAKREKGGYMYSLQIGIKRGDRTAPFVPVHFNFDSLKVQSTGPKLDHDYVAIFTKLVAEAQEYVVVEMQQAHALRQQYVVDRDSRKTGPKAPVTRQEHAEEWRKNKERQEKRR